MNPSFFKLNYFRRGLLSLALAAMPVLSHATTHDGGSAAEHLKQEVATIGEDLFTARDYKPGLIRHIVLFRYKPGVTAAQKEEAKIKFLALRSSERENRKYIVSIETGSNISGEGADQNLEQGFVVTFRSQGDRNFYVGQPVVNDPRHYDSNHQAFKEFVGPLLDTGGALVFDFAVEK